ncbi:MAG: DNA adenine methylase [Methanoregula sp.]|jgi:DNA adenine methylase
MQNGARPFLKWAGGKAQLLAEFKKRFPPELKKGRLVKYVEPFIGGGAVFFYLNQRFRFEECTLCDVNEELILAYRVIKRSLPRLTQELVGLSEEYIRNDPDGRKNFYYRIRDEFNRELPAINFRTYNARWIHRAAQIIFLNRTCYNGLFRVNQNGGFNVPPGKYSSPDIVNAENLAEVSVLLKNTRIIRDDFSACGKFADEETFVYLDPPYRPLNPTSSFTSYSRQGFSDSEQRRLAEFFRMLDRKGAKVMLSNSDPGNEDPDDSFFEELYRGYSICRVPAKRMINCNGTRRGEITELIITNY